MITESKNSEVTPRDEEIILHKPLNDEAEPELSIVVPALNEELTIGEFVDWCNQGIKEAGIKGEILIVDSSTDRTREIALAHGARVLQTPKRGLGRAYIDALPYARSKYLVLGDCDCTYDFRELKPFVKAFHGGYNFVMGSRFKGYIEDGAMPALHRYFGTPLTTWILNFIYKSKFSDIHCGMRGITKPAFQRMGLSSQGWEYASEMVLKSVHMGLNTTEVPIRFYKDREGRLSHHKRMGWLSPWLAGWVNLKAMFVYGAHFFLFKPGILLLTMGLLLTVPVVSGPIHVFGVTFSLYWMLLGVAFTIVGLQCIYMGILNQVVLDYSGKKGSKWTKIFSYNRTVIFSALTGLAGILLNIPLLVEYISNGYQLTEGLNQQGYHSVFGILLALGGFMTFTFVLVLHALCLNRGKKNGN